MATRQVNRQPRPSGHYPSFDNLPDTAFVRQSQLVYNPRRPGVPVTLPFTASTLWRKVADGTFPKPLKLGARTTAWKVSDVRAWLSAQEGDAA